MIVITVHSPANLLTSNFEFEAVVVSVVVVVSTVVVVTAVVFLAVVVVATAFVVLGAIVSAAEFAPVMAVVAVVTSLLPVFFACRR